MTTANPNYPYQIDPYTGYPAGSGSYLTAQTAAMNNNMAMMGSMNPYTMTAQNELMGYAAPAASTYVNPQTNPTSSAASINAQQSQRDDC